MSILKRLESEPYRFGKTAVADSATEHSIDEVTQIVREKVLDKHPSLVLEARMSKQKRAEVTAIVSEMIVSGNLYVNRLTRKDLAEQIVKELCGLGPLDDLLEDESVTEIMVNGHNEVYVEREGKIERVPVSFKDDAHLLELINRIVQAVGRRVDVSMPYVDARLPDGSRVNAIIPPLALNGPTLTIRRFPRRFTSTDELISNGTITPEAARFLKAAVDSRLDVVVSGGSSTGKTTTLNVLANQVDPGERIIVIEDSSEVRIAAGHVVYLESRPPNVEGKGQVTLRDLLRNALRMRPDRLVVGECRGKETLDLVIAMNTGHEGCLATVHANSSRDCVERMVGMALMAGEGVPAQVVKRWVGIAVDVILHMARRQGGTRILEQISLVGEDEGGNVQVYPVFDVESGWKDVLPSWFGSKVGQERLRNLNSVLALCSSKGGANS